MQRTLLASVIIMSLSACDGGLLSKDNETIKTDTPAIGNDIVDTTTDTTTDDATGTPAPGGSGSTISDDAGSSTSDGGETSGGSNNAGGNSGSGTVTGTTGSGTGNTGSGSDSSNNGNAGSGSSDGNTNAGDDKYGDDDEADDNYDDDKYDDDSSSDTGGQVSDDTDGNTSTGSETDDSGSATSDGGETDDSGSATSDGGATDDSGSSTSDGGQPDDTDSGTDTDNSDGGDFSSDNVGGSVIRTSTLSTTAQQNICTTASAQNNFSDMRVGDFILHNNAWRPFRAFPDYEWEQCIYSNTNGALVGWNYDWGPGITGINGATSASGDFYVRSYPELIYGVKDEFRTSAPQSETGFPVELGQMPNISIDYSYDGPQYGESRVVDASNNPRFPNGSTISGERNVAIESFFYNKDAAGQCSTGIVTRNGGSNHVYEVMVWLDAGAERLPAGPSDFVTNLSIRGADYKVYTKNSDSRYIAFVAQNPQSSGTIYWNDFIDWAKDNAHQVQARFGARSNSVQIQDNWCIANIIVGTEIFWGAGNLDIYNWTITQSQ